MQYLINVDCQLLTKHLIAEKITYTRINDKRGVQAE